MTQQANRGCLPFCVPPGRWWTVPLALGALIQGPSARPLHGQVGGEPSVDSNVEYLSLNALATGLATGVLAKLRGHSFSRAFVGGALGGVVGYTGKYLATRRFVGSGLVGRQVAAVGYSIARNSSAGEIDAFPLVLPVGPLRIHASNDQGLTLQFGLSLTDLAFTGYGVLSPDLQLDWSRTISTGTAVFVSRGRGLADRDGDPIGGATIGGVVFLADVGPFDQNLSATHEMVHVIQNDGFEQILSDRLDAWVVSELLGDRVQRVSINSVRLSLNGFLNGPPFLRSALEAEAEFLEVR